MPRMNNITMTRTLAAVALILAGASAQAAHLTVLSGTAQGGIDAGVTIGRQATTVTGTLADLSGDGQLLAAGGGAQTLALADGTAWLEWSQAVSLESGGDQRPATFLATGSSVLSVASASPVTRAQVAAEANLQAALTVASDGEAVGTAVRVDLTGLASSLFASDMRGAQDVVSYELVVRDAQQQVLASFTGLPAGAGDTFSLSFASRVGDALQLSLRQASRPGSFAGQSIPSGETRRLESSVLLQGEFTVSAVPEAQSLALVLAGLAVVGVGHVRRRQL